MNKKQGTPQESQWSGSFGRQYTDRNLMSLEEMEDLWKRNYGFSRSQMNEAFLTGMSPHCRILEVGSNIGNQLACLQKGGFHELYGLDVQFYAVAMARKRIEGLKVAQGSAFELPFKDRAFDMVFTSGLLTHIAPGDIHRVMDEIFRCSKRFIWGAEYYHTTHIEIPYRGHQTLMWKGDFSKMFLDRFGDMQLVKKVLMKYLENENVDVMYLLEKK